MAEELTREQAEALYREMSNADLQAELGERNLVKTGNKDDLVARLLDADFPPAGDDPGAGDPPVEDGEDGEDGELCGICWPDGWPNKDTAAASCEHGVWDRISTLS